jgi:hypothetical protein
MGNPLTHKPHYRAYVINKVPSVRVLDYRRIKEAVSFFCAEKRFSKIKKGEEQAEQILLIIGA